MRTPRKRRGHVWLPNVRISSSMRPEPTTPGIPRAKEGNPRCLLPVLEQTERDYNRSGTWAPELDVPSEQLAGEEFPGVCLYEPMEVDSPPPGGRRGEFQEPWPILQVVPAGMWGGGGGGGM